MINRDFIMDTKMCRMILSTWTILPLRLQMTHLTEPHTLLCFAGQYLEECLLFPDLHHRIQTLI